MESKRIRTAKALDELEKVVLKCCKIGTGHYRDATTIQNEDKFNIIGAIMDAADSYSVDVDDLKGETLRMLRNELSETYYGLRCEVRYVKPLMEDGECVGMSVKYYVWR